MSDAPNFNGEYPGAGAKIGPAWQAAWDRMEGGDWISSGDLADVMMTAVDIQFVTAKNLLSSARRAGVIQVKRGAGSRRNGHRQAAYRRES
jgi:hypothetical protein